MSILLENKVALVTGANRGIGKAIVESFLKQGAKKIYLAVRDPSSTYDLVEQYGNKVVTLKVDMAKPEDIQALAKAATDVEIVVNNAGVLEVADLLTDDNFEQALTKQLDINLFGLVRIARALSPVIEANGGGALVQLNSIVSIRNFSGVDAYSASKAASYSITQGLREQLADKNIAVVSVHPGPIDTDMAAKAGLTDGASTNTVADGIVTALAEGQFHLFPDQMAKQFEGAYQSFAQSIVLADLNA